MSLARELIQKQETLAKDRAIFEQHWSEIAPLVLPRQDDFFGEKKEDGEKRTRKKFDDTATLAIDHGAAAVEGVVSPRGQMWHGIGLPDSLQEDQEALEWADKLTKFLFRKRYAPESNFASNLHECYISLLAFGTAVMQVEDMLNGSIRYKASHIGEHFFCQNRVGIVDMDYRKYRLTARQAMEKFKDKTPERVRQALEKDPSQKFEFLHVVMPDVDNETENPFISYHISIEDSKILSVGSFRTFPYIISRWITSPNETYGRSPTMNVLSEIKMLNQMRKTDIKARHLAVDPPILAADQQTIRGWNSKPGALNFGTLDQNGNPLIRPYNSGVNINASNDGMEQSREFINRAYFLNLFQILVDAPQMTATEVLQRAQEKGQLLTPSAGRQMSELLEPIINREISIFESYGIFEDGQPLALPQSVKDAGGVFSVKFTNPLSRMQMAEEAVATERTVESMLTKAQFEPMLLKRIDWMKYSDIIRGANGAPADLFHSDEELQEIIQGEQQRQQMQQMVQAAPQVAGAIRDIAEAQNAGS